MKAEPGLPRDPRIPALEALRDGRAGTVLAGAGLTGSFSFERVLRHRVGRRCTLLFSGDSEKIAIKAYRDSEPPAHCLHAITAVERWRAGGGGEARCPRVLAYDPKLHFIANEWFEGPSAEVLINSGRGSRAGRLAAQWLTEIQVPSGLFAPIKLRVAPLARAAEKAATIEGVEKSWGKKASGLLDALQSRAPAVPDDFLCHGSFKPEHLLDLGVGPGLLDWDSAKVGPVELDGGAFLGKLSLLKISRPDERGEIEKSREAFLQGTLGLLHPPALAWYEAFSLLKAAGTACRLQGLEAERLAPRLLDEALSVLEMEGPA